MIGPFLTFLKIVPQVLNRLLLAGKLEELTHRNLAWHNFIVLVLPVIMFLKLPGALTPVVNLTRPLLVAIAPVPPSPRYLVRTVENLLVPPPHVVNALLLGPTKMLLLKLLKTTTLLLPMTRATLPDFMTVGTLREWVTTVSRDACLLTLAMNFPIQLWPNRVALSGAKLPVMMTILLATADGPGTPIFNKRSNICLAMLWTLVVCLRTHGPLLTVLNTLTNTLVILESVDLVPILPLWTPVPTDLTTLGLDNITKRVLKIRVLLLLSDIVVPLWTVSILDPVALKSLKR